MHAYRSHTCAELNTSHAGQTVRLSGWVHRVRDHGGVLFVDLRDHYGVTQVLADSDSPAFAAIEKLKAETVIRVDGRVKARDAGLVNPKIPTGEVELLVVEATIFNRAETPPFEVSDEIETREEARLILEAEEGQPFTSPPEGAIAHRLLRDWVDWPAQG